jgi:hypothetical protein
MQELDEEFSKEIESLKKYKQTNLGNVQINK